MGNKLECDCFFLGMLNTTITAPQEKYRGECNCKYDLAVYLQWTTRGDLQSLCLARTFVLKPRTAVACRGTPLSGHTRKWNCWTWRVSLDPLCVKIRQVSLLFCSKIKALQWKRLRVPHLLVSITLKGAMPHYLLSFFKAKAFLCIS